MREVERVQAVAAKRQEREAPVLRQAEVRACVVARPTMFLVGTDIGLIQPHLPRTQAP